MQRPFVHGIVNSIPVSPNFEDGLRVQRVLDAVERSNHTKQRVIVGEHAIQSIAIQFL